MNTYFAIECFINTQVAGQWGSTREELCNKQLTFRASAFLRAVLRQLYVKPVILALFHSALKLEYLLQLKLWYNRTATLLNVHCHVRHGKRLVAGGGQGFLLL